MKMVLSVVVALAVLGGVLYFVAPYLKTAEPAMVEEGTEEAGVEIKTERIQESDAAYVIDVRYPQFGIASIDAQIKEVVSNAVTEFKSLPTNPAGSATPQNSFDGSYDSVYIGPDVVSVKLILSQYTGGAHPLTLVSGLNYDRETGRQLLQSDAFAMLGMSVEQVSAAATSELKAELGDAMFEEGANANPENFSSFVISENEVTFIFQQYQVAAYAAGVHEVSFPRK
ncbi:DUF3298 domain-containing protein [Candidatus Parcubacteria bacterium]|nr:MAG: DUF3298 domain-containing protein [Candidatus Parcubacteria bacterium]